MKLTILGTSAAKPTDKRNTSAYVLTINGDDLLFDCGENTQKSLLESGIGFHGINKIFISHLHMDHVGGLCALLNGMLVSDRKEKLDLYGPFGLKKMMDIQLKSYGIKISNYVCRFHVLNEGVCLKTKDYTIESTPADHRIEAHSFRVSLPDKRPFLPHVAKALGIPKGSLYGELKDGNPVTLEDGRIINPDLVLGDVVRGKSFGYSGDSTPLRKFAKFFKDCTCVVFDSTYINNDLEKAKKFKHSTSIQAANLLKKSNVGILVLSHFSSRYHDTLQHEKEASLYHKNVVCAEDGQQINI